MTSAYRYFGLLFGRLNLKVSLDSATLKNPGDHAAVWLGVNAPGNASWVQGGVEQEHGSPPCIYIEVGKDGGQASIQRWAWTLGRRVKVKLRRIPKRRLGADIWVVSVAGYKSRAVRVRKPTIDATLETLGPVKAVARIGRKRVTS